MSWDATQLAPSGGRFRWVGRLAPRDPVVLDLDPVAGDLAAEARARRAGRMTARNLWASLVIGASFLAVAIALAATLPSQRSPTGWVIALLVVSYAVASRVEFEVGAGSCVPTELILLPMLFLLPLGQVPLWLALGYVLGATPEVLRREQPADRLLIPLCGSWHVIGPVCVLAAAGESAPHSSAWPIYVAALVAQFAFDLGSSALRDRLAHGVPLRVLVRYLGWVFLVDALLAGVGLAIAYTASAHPPAAVLALPLVALLAFFARERRTRIDHALELTGAYRGTGMLAQTYREILSEGTLDPVLQRIADRISGLIDLDGLTVAGTGDDGASVVLLQQGAPADGDDLAQMRVELVTRGRAEVVLTAYRRAAAGAFDDDETQLVRWFADTAALALDHARARQALELQARSDSLTSLLNHGAFQALLGAEVRRVRDGDGTTALLLLDVDDFKRINDVHGHAVGDQVLSRLAGVLRRNVRRKDRVCRIGGEEFAVILPSGDAEGALAVAARIAAELAVSDFEPVGQITVSAGVAVGPEDATSVRELTACADAAMLAAKAGGKNQALRYQGNAAGVPAGEARPGRSRRHEDLRSIAHLKLLQSLAGKLNRLNDVASIGEAIVDELRTLIDFHVCRVYVADGDLLVPIALRGEHEAYDGETVDALTVRFGEGVTGTAAARREALLIDDSAQCEFAVQIDGTDTIDESMVAVPLLHGATAIGVIVVSKVGLRQFDESDVRLLEVLAGHASVAIQNARLLETVRLNAGELEQDFLSTVEALANALEAKNADTSSHARAITDLAVAIGTELEFDTIRLKRLELGALLHDIGKIGIPSEILGKPGPLTPDEYRVVQQHPELGERILAPIARLGDVRRIVRHCHEHWDGGGYPDRLAGTEIPLEARIVLVVDAYHAMTTDRPYRGRLPEEEAWRRLRAGAGTQFDPEVVDTFLRLLECSALPSADALVA
jgi:diguanylate cyclase (GGDEF)-like protein